MIISNIKVKAKDLRNRSESEKIPADRPGYYKWWASKTDLERLLVRLDLSFPQIADYMECSEDCQYCIYVGIAAKESVRSRLNWHINRPYTVSNVKHRTLSTLKQSISALICNTMLDSDEINAFIDCLCVEYYLSDYEIKSEAAIREIKKIENSYLKESDKLYILNIQENKHPKACNAQIKRLRKMARENALNSR